MKIAFILSKLRIAQNCNSSNTINVRNSAAAAVGVTPKIAYFGAAD